MSNPIVEMSKSISVYASIPELAWLGQTKEDGIFDVLTAGTPEKMTPDGWTIRPGLEGKEFHKQVSDGLITFRPHADGNLTAIFYKNGWGCLIIEAFEGKSISTLLL